MRFGRIKVFHQDAAFLKQRSSHLPCQCFFLVLEETVILPQRTAYKIVLKKYLQVKKEYTSDGQMRIQLSQVKAALKIAGYSFDEDLMERLFSGSGIYTVSGQKSARLLRNGIEHEMNVNDLQEVHDRLASLFADMDSFITWIQL